MQFNLHNSTTAGNFGDENWQSLLHGLNKSDNMSSKVPAHGSVVRMHKRGCLVESYVWNQDVSLAMQNENFKLQKENNCYPKIVSLAKLKAE